MQSVYGNYRTRTFNDIFSDENAFITAYTTNGIPTSISTTDAKTLYYLLYGKYGNAHIMSSDENTFKYRLFTVVFSSGPAWIKKLEAQRSLAGLTEEELLNGTKTIYNHSYNPSTVPSTDTLDELETIDDQNTTKFKYNKIDAYTKLLAVLDTDVTTEFLLKFRPLFLQVLEPQYPLWYVSDDEEEQ